MSDLSLLSPKTIKGIAAVYALLALVVICAGLGAYAAYTLPSKASAKVEAWRGKEVDALRRQLGDQNLTRLADKYINDRAAAIGLGVVKIVVLSVTTDGNDATVIASATFTDGVSQVTQRLKVTFKRGIWNAQRLTSA